MIYTKENSTLVLSEGMSIKQTNDDNTQTYRNRMCVWRTYNIFPRMAQQPLVGQCLLLVEASRSHPDTPHSIGLLWKSDRSDTEAST